MPTFQSAGDTGSLSSSAVRAAAASQKQTAAAKSNEGSMSSSAAQAADAPAQKQTAAAKSKTGGTTKASKSSGGSIWSSSAAQAAADAKSKTGGTTKGSTNLIVVCEISSNPDISQSLTLCLQFAPIQSSSISTASQKKVKLHEVRFPCCQHGDKETYVMLDDKSYFSKKYLENTPTWPSTCAKQGCSSGAFGQVYKVGISHPVYCCSNAKNKNHPCMHAYCKPCFDAW